MPNAEELTRTKAEERKRAKVEQRKRLDDLIAVLDSLQEGLPTFTDLPYDLFAASTKVRDGLYEWAVQKRAATAEGTPAPGQEPTPPRREPANAPEGKPDKEWAWPGLERPAEREGRIVSEPDRYATKPLAPAAGSPPDPKVGTVSDPTSEKTAPVQSASLFWRQARRRRGRRPGGAIFRAGLFRPASSRFPRPEVPTWPGLPMTARSSASRTPGG